MVALRVYRSYVTAEGPDALDRAFLQEAAEDARAAVGEPAAVDFILRLLLLEVEAPLDRRDVLPFVARFQQTSGPVMAKAIEDTLYYRDRKNTRLNSSH